MEKSVNLNLTIDIPKDYILITKNEYEMLLNRIGSESVHTDIYKEFSMQDKMSSTNGKQYEKLTISVSEIADSLGVSTTTIYTMARQNEIPHKKVRGRILFHKPTIEQWLMDNE